MLDKLYSMPVANGSTTCRIVYFDCFMREKADQLVSAFGKDKRRQSEKYYSYVLPN